MRGRVRKVTRGRYRQTLKGKWLNYQKFRLVGHGAAAWEGQRSQAHQLQSSHSTDIYWEPIMYEIFTISCLSFSVNNFYTFWLCWVLVATLAFLSANRSYSSLHCAGFLQWLLLLWSTGSGAPGFSSGGTWAQQSGFPGSGAQAQ